MNKNWSNTALVAYSILPKIVRELDKGVINRVNSSFQSRHLKIGVSTERLIDEILELNEEKRKIVNLRYIVNKALQKMSKSNKEILIARMIEKQTFQSIAEHTNTSLRTVFRHVSNAEDEFRRYMIDDGFTDEWFDKEYGEDKYIAPIHQRVMEDKYFVAKNL